MRPPDITIGENYLERWHIIPRNRYFNIYLHKFTGSDDDRALHDHPWHSVSFLLSGELVEVSRGHHCGVYHYKRVRRFLPKLRAATFAHRLVVRKGPVWTVFVTGPRIRQWGFLCPEGWRHWKVFTSADGLRVGRGCD